MSNSAHPYVTTIRRYYDGCNSGDVAQMASTFSDDVVHYFVDHAPVETAQALANFWAKVGPRTRAVWSVDHALVMDDEAVIEWSMQWVPPGGEDAEMLRGTEWFRFRGGLIAEIRSYHCNWHLRSPDNAALHGFPYAERGYAAVGPNPEERA
jgi:hypothetical protein